MRRLILEEPYSRAAIWGRRLAFFAIALALISVVVARTNSTDPASGLAVLSGGILMACLAVLFALTGAVVIWRTGRKGAGIVVTTLLVSTLLLAYPTYLAVLAVQLPLMSDITTDTLEPPNFMLSKKAMAARSGRVYSGTTEEQKLQQRVAYPNVQPMLLDMEGEESYQLVLKAIAARGWRIIDQTIPQTGGRTGNWHIDAVERTPIMNYQDDITIRIRPLAGQTRIDIRSASRIGRHDYGVNASRIEKFTAELQEQLDNK